MTSMTDGHPQQRRRTWRGYHPRKIQQVVGRVRRRDFYVRDARTNDVRRMTVDEWHAAMRQDERPQAPRPPQTIPGEEHVDGY
jgi:hypothetical protein